MAPTAAAKPESLRADSKIVSWAIRRALHQRSMQLMEETSGSFTSDA